MTCFFVFHSTTPLAALSILEKSKFGMLFALVVSIKFIFNRRETMLCSNQLTASFEDNGENGIQSCIANLSRAIAKVGTDVLLHTGLVTISAISFFTALWFTLYLLF